MSRASIAAARAPTAEREAPPIWPSRAVTAWAPISSASRSDAQREMGVRPSASAAARVAARPGSWAPRRRNRSTRGRRLGRSGAERHVQLLQRVARDRARARAATRRFAHDGRGEERPWRARLARAGGAHQAGQVLAGRRRSPPPARESPRRSRAARQHVVGARALADQIPEVVHERPWARRPGPPGGPARPRSDGRPPPPGLAAALCHQQRPVGAVEQLAAGQRLAPASHPDGGRHVVPAPRHTARGRCRAGRGRAGLGRAGRVHPRQHQHELVTTEAARCRRSGGTRPSIASATCAGSGRRPGGRGCRSPA